MTSIIYALLLAVVFTMWLWSVYMQQELTSNSVSLKAGDTISYMIAIIIGLGVATIVVSNFLPIQAWKVFIFLILMALIDVVIVYLTAKFVHAMTSHKVTSKYRIENKEREDRHLVTSIILAVIILLVMVLINEIELSIMLFLFTPIVLLIERTVSLKKRIREVSEFDVFTVEEIQEADDKLAKAIEDGTVLKPKTGVFQRVVGNERKRYKQVRDAMKESVATKQSEQMEEIKRKNDELEEENNKEEENNIEEEKNGDD